MEEVLKKPEKLCNECMHYSTDEWIAWCNHNADEIIDYSPINGRAFTRGEHVCDFYRGAEYTDKPKGCGPEAKYWEPAPLKPPSWLERFLRQWKK